MVVRDDTELCGVGCDHQHLIDGAQDSLRDDGAYAHLAALFGALADTTRAKIVHLLLQQELCTSDIAALVGISESGVSQHLRVLRALHLVKSRRDGKFVYYTLDDAHVALLIQVGLTHQSHECRTVSVRQARSLQQEER